MSSSLVKVLVYKKRNGMNAVLDQVGVCRFLRYEDDKSGMLGIMDRVIYEKSRREQQLYIKVVRSIIRPG
jgi:hypothetical protein